MRIKIITICPEVGYLWTTSIQFWSPSVSALTINSWPNGAEKTYSSWKTIAMARWSGNLSSKLLRSPKVWRSDDKLGKKTHFKHIKDVHSGRVLIMCSEYAFTAIEPIILSAWVCCIRHVKRFIHHSQNVPCQGSASRVRSRTAFWVFIIHSLHTPYCVKCWCVRRWSLQPFLFFLLCRVPRERRKEQAALRPPCFPLFVSVCFCCLVEWCINVRQNIRLPLQRPIRSKPHICWNYNNQSGRFQLSFCLWTRWCMFVCILMCFNLEFWHLSRTRTSLP